MHRKLNTRTTSIARRMTGGLAGLIVACAGTTAATAQDWQSDRWRDAEPERGQQRVAERGYYGERVRANQQYRVGDYTYGDDDGWFDDWFDDDDYEWDYSYEGPRYEYESEGEIEYQDDWRQDRQRQARDRQSGDRQARSGEVRRDYGDDDYGYYGYGDRGYYNQNGGDDYEGDASASYDNGWFDDWFNGDDDADRREARNQGGRGYYGYGDRGYYNQNDGNSRRNGAVHTSRNSDRTARNIDSDGWYYDDYDDYEIGDERWVDIEGDTGYDDREWFDDEYMYDNYTYESDYGYDNEYTNREYGYYGYGDRGYYYNQNQARGYGADYPYYYDEPAGYYEADRGRYYQDDFGFDHNIGNTFGDTQATAEGRGYVDVYNGESNRYSADRYYNQMRRATGPDRQRAERDRAQRQRDDASGRSAQHRTARVRGNIDNVEFIRGAQPGDSQPAIVRLTMDDGRTALINLGPRVDKRNIPLGEGDKVTLYGNRRTMNDRQILDTHTIEARGRTIRLRSSGSDAQQDRRISQRDRQWQDQQRQAQRDRQRRPDQQRQQQVQRTASVQGTVDSINRVNVGPDRFTVARVRMNNGRTRYVAVREDKIPAFASLDMATGDRVSARGDIRQLGDRRVLMVNNLKLNGETLLSASS